MHGSGRTWPFVPIHPLKNLYPAPDRLRGLGQSFSIGVADSLLCESTRDRAGDGNELVWRCRYGCADTASASGRAARPGRCG